MKNLLLQLVLAATLAVAVAAPWALVQTAAWAGMAVSYSIHQGSLVQGLEQTFDGRHPCAACRAIEQDRQQGGAPGRAAWLVMAVGTLASLGGVFAWHHRQQSICALQATNALCMEAGFEDS